MGAFQTFQKPVNAKLTAGGTTITSAAAVAVEFQTPHLSGTRIQQVGKIEILNKHATTLLWVMFGTSTVGDLSAEGKAHVIVKAGERWVQEVDEDIFLVRASTGTLAYDPAGAVDVVIVGYPRR